LAGPALAQTPQPPLLDYDLLRGRLRIVAQAQTLELELAADSLALAWQSHVLALARGASEPDAAARWGALLLPRDSERWLAAAPRWRILDLELAGLDAVAPPWSPNSPLVASVETVFGPEGSAQAHGAGGVALQPFHGVDASRDSPDTLDAALLLGLAHVDHLPRNDVAVALLRELFAARAYEVLSLRATTPLPAGWAEALRAAPPLRLWSWPAAAEVPGAELCRLWELLAADASLVADRWPLSERLRAGDLAAWMQRLQQGESVGRALCAVKRQLAARGEPAGRWAGWIAVGDGEYRLQSPAPNRWQAWLRRWRAQSVAIQLPPR
jgi:hypothetical protein